MLLLEFPRRARGAAALPQSCKVGILAICTIRTPKNAQSLAPFTQPA